MDSFQFSAELWIWKAREENGWTFVTVPPAESEQIRELAVDRPRAGFGSVRVTASIGSSTWQTSVFPGDNGCYVLPIKKAIRRAEAIESGDVVPVTVCPVVDEDR